jgi:hypothetical protein
MNQQSEKEEVFKNIRKEKEVRLAGYFLKISVDEVKIFGITVWKRRKK